MTPPDSIDPIAQISQAIAAGLPGADAQYQMAPGHRPGPEVTANPPPDARLAAVLILLYPGLISTSADAVQSGDSSHARPEHHIPMILRPPRTGPHSGQISFPGGAYESHDNDLGATALRESQEELGIRPADVQVLGTLSKLYVPPSGYLVTPYVGWSERRPDFVADPREVDLVLEIPLAHLIEPANRRSEERDTKYGRTRIPYFAFRRNAIEHKIWGASAMILAELLAVLD